MPNDTTHTPVWLITGCSSGFGRELAKLIIDRGWHLVATARDKSRLGDLVQRAGERVLAVELDVGKADQVEAAVAAAREHFGRVDVLVNNAGYGYQSSIEEGEEAEIRAQFDANVFGLFAVTRAVLPIMRAQRSGHIINITSVAGLIGFPGSGYYAASKHAVEGFSDALSAEVKPLGISVTCVEPGPFRTDWAGRSLRQTPSRIDDYKDTAAKRMNSTKQLSGTQAGDPVRAADAMIALTQRPDAPRHLVLGSWGYDTVLADRRARLEQTELLRDISVGADFPNE
ncbi:oxidoreductase [Pseudomonas typographi]|uniref:SDR family NAD(P)-dependent oxidoreductase n=1 Tax=Pseudomonas typographi TaxID=2715964 RepID=A0ABR7YWH5_9PSED|nr:oxidoreductase [Pseudomonas typographi]MBD1552437.1 SDR family NAD(P)-dependent oxidoreductase [Pseudomonas typographi]MBD1585527.1 SDR family NAD(P)-dependent oxidoreductase [Pseudomonas typographi]MBD1597558.1 SDR family NAD(P)-dependent oxidoreductase [Pseudomonas typographi]